MKNVKILIVIVNYKSTNDLIELLDSINKLKYKNHDILVIDNNSQESLEELKKYKIKLIENKDNLGFTGAINQALKNYFGEPANAPVVLLIKAVIKPTITILIKP